MKNPLAEILGFSTPGMDQFVSRKNIPSYNEVFPHVRTDQLAYRRLLLGIASEMPEVAPLATHAAGELASGSGVATDWSEFRTVMAVLPNPAGTPPLDSTPYAKETLETAGTKDLATEALKRERVRYIGNFEFPADIKKIVSDFASAFVDNLVVTSFPIKRSSSMGVPHMTADLITKAEAIQGWLQNGKRYVQLLRDKDMPALAREGLVFCYFNAYRAQIEGTKIEGAGSSAHAVTAKVRLVQDWLGKWLPMDRSLPEQEGEGEAAEAARLLLCARSRTISASPFNATLFQRVLARSMEKGLGERYPHTFKHRDEPDIVSKTRRAKRYGLTDVKSNDQMMNFFCVEAFCEAVGRKTSALMRDWLLYTFQAPMLVRNDYRGGNGAVMRGNPLVLDSFNARYVNPSGIPVTSQLTKMVGALYIFLAGYFYGWNNGSYTDAVAFLSGQADVKLLNLGDNNFTYTEQDKNSDFVSEPWKWMPYAILEPTDTFAGYIVSRDARGGIVLQRNLSTYVKNIVTPDRTMSHPLKGNWAVSLPIKRVLYRSHPLFEVVDKKLDALVLQHLGSTLDELAAMTPIDPVLARVANLIDAEFLNNPEAIEYKFDSEEVDPKLLEQFYLTGTRDDAQRIFDLFTGS